MVNLNLDPLWVKHRFGISILTAFLIRAIFTLLVSAQIQSEEPQIGFVEDYDEEQGFLIMRKIDIDAEIELETMVATSGLGDVYPAGLEIGQVVHVEPDEYGLSQNVYIQPTADFSALDYVYIVERTSVTLDPSLLEGEE